MSVRSPILSRPVLSVPIVSVTAVSMVLISSCSSDGADDGASPSPSPGESVAEATADPAAEPAAEVVEAPPAPEFAEVLYETDFSSGEEAWAPWPWRLEGGYAVGDFPAGQAGAVALNPDVVDWEAQDSLEVSATVDPGGVSAVGLDCAYERDSSTSRYYAVELGTAGAVLRKQVWDPQRSADTIAENPDVVLPATPVDLTLGCVFEEGATHIYLSVDGEQVLAYADVDEPLAPGDSGIVVRGGESEATVRLDQYRVRAAA